MTPPNSKPNPVLLHATLKPSYGCVAAALAALPDVAPHELVVIGDHIFTDVVLAHCLTHPRTLFGRIASCLWFTPMPPDDAGSGAGTAEALLYAYDDNSAVGGVDDGRVDSREHRDALCRGVAFADC